MLALSYVGFVSLGLPDSILGAAWPMMRAELGLPLDAAGPLVLLATCGAVVSSAVSGRLLVRLSTGVVLAASASFAALALLGFAIAPSWWWMMGAALIAGLGGGAVDAALNGYVARHHDVRHMNWLHGCWGIGATLGPLTLAALLAAGRSWRTTYGWLAAVELMLAVAFVVTMRRWPAPEAAPSSPSRGHVSAAMGKRVAFFFLYGGIEAGAGLWGATYLVETRGAGTSQASAIVGAYWGGLMVGRFVLGALTAAIHHQRLVRLSVRAALGALVLLALPGTPVPVAGAALAALGVALAAIYPSVMHETPQLFDSDTSRHLVGYQIAAGSLGIATIPWLLGIAARHFTPAIIPGALAGLATVLVLLETHRRGASAVGTS